MSTTRERFWIEQPEQFYTDNDNLKMHFDKPIKVAQINPGDVILTADEAEKIRMKLTSVLYELKSGDAFWRCMLETSIDLLTSKMEKK